MESCSNLDFHGPYEQTWTNDELPYAQGKILAVDESSDPPMMTVKVSGWSLLHLTKDG